MGGDTLGKNETLWNKGDHDGACFKCGELQPIDRVTR